MKLYRLPIKNVCTVALLILSFFLIVQTTHAVEFDDFDNAPPLTQGPLNVQTDHPQKKKSDQMPFGSEQRAGFWGFVGTNLGYSTFLSQQPIEVDKDGFQLDLKAIIAWDLGEWVFDLGAGWFYNRLEGSPSETPLSISTRALFLEVTPHLRLTESWNLAWVNNILVGADTTFDESVNSEIKTRWMSGLRVQYEIPTDTSLLRVGGQVLTDINIKHRQILWMQLDLQIGLPFSGQKLTPVKMKPPKLLQTMDQLRVTGKQSVQLTLDEDLIHFRTGSPLPDVRSRRFLKRLGQFLIDNDDNWAEVQVEGHTDNRGAQSLNENLSFQRAANVREVLIGVGVRTGKINAKGFGPNLPIDPSNNESAWAKNRRVELRFSGVKDPEKFVEKLNEFKADF